MKNSAKKQQKEARELQKWQKEQSRPRPLSYFVVMIIVLTIIYIVDEVATNICGTVSTNITFDLFNIVDRDITSDEYANAANIMALLGIVSALFQILAPFYKSLSDRYGRRVFLAINTVGMALGMLVVMIAPNPIVYAIGFSIISFVVPNDVQVIYIMESVKPEDRAKWCNITKAFAILGISSIGLLRTIFLDEANPSSWRLIFIIPVILAAFVGVMSVFFMRETPVFMTQRIEYLSATDDERKEKAELKAKEEKEQKGGVVNAIRFIFKHKQLKWLAICTMLFSFTSAATSFYNAIMVGGGMSETEISKAVMVYPFVYALVTVISGFFSDKKGRKTTCLTFGTLAMVSLVLFVLATKYYSQSGIIVGILYGAYVGGTWSTGDTLLMTFPQESSPTNLRASIVGMFFVFLMVGGIGTAAVVVIYNFFRDYGWICFAMAVPFMIAALIVMKTKIHETRGVDLDAVTGEEWD